jgi:uncharacterized protein (DUF934 family)
MSRLLKSDGTLASDDWTYFTGYEEAGSLPGGDIVIAAEQWAEARERLAGHNGRIGILLKNTEDPRSIGGDAARFSLIVLEFPGMNDGRAFSQARILREQMGFDGEIRATGDVLRDQLYYMKRCGFDSFELRADQDIDGAIAALSEITVTYQAAADEPKPLFRRVKRPAAGA